MCIRDRALDDALADDRAHAGDGDRPRTSRSGRHASALVRKRVQDVYKRQVEDQENVYYYLTVMNENYPQPGLTAGDEEGIIKGMYKLKSHGKGKNLSLIHI